VTVDREFFVSFTGADRSWATWLVAELDAAGYTSVSQLRDFVAGTNFAVEMDQAARRARRTLGVLSPQALQAPYVRQEWVQRLATDPTGQQHALVLVRVEPCEPAGLLGPVVYIDLVGLDEAAARARLGEELAAAVRGQRPLPAEAAFPGGGPGRVVADVEKLRFPTALPPVWNLPFRRNPAFTGREQTLAELAEQLDRDAAAAVTQTLQGPGGVGKTALAVEYAYRYRSQFDTVWWVRAEQPATLVGDYAGLAGVLQLPGAGQADQQLAVVAARRWLEEHDRWLLVLDNAEGPDTPTGLEVPLAGLVDLLPRVLHGQVLVTSRDASWEDHAGLAELEVFSPDEAVAFLLGRSGSSDQAAATQVAELLGLLPLALEQAGAYVRETRLSLGDYLERLRGYPALTVTKGRPRDRDPTDTVATTWQVSLERVRPTPGAAVLLEVCGFLGPEEIPRELFARRLDPPVGELHTLAEDPFALDGAVAALRRFGLVKAAEQMLSVHRLLQQVVRDSLDPASKVARVGVAVRLLERALPFGGRADPGLWPVCARLLPHALAATEYAEQLGVEPLATAGLLESVADYLHGRARYPDARRLHERVLAIRQAHLGADHPSTAQSLSNLAAVVRAQGDLAGARGLYERALAIRETHLGPDHPETAWTLSNIAVVLRDQGDLVDARRLHERALAICETHLGPDHPDTAWILNNFAGVLRDLGNLADARRLLERALAILEIHRGADHLTTAWTLNNLAGVLRDQDDVADARRLYERALAIRETHLGADHPDTAQSLNYLAAVVRDQDDLTGARRLLERALAIRETHLGPDHPDTAWTLNNLAVVLRAQGDLAGARRMHERALAIREARLGANHPDTAWTLTNLGDVLHAQGDLAGARRRLERALAIRETRRGPDHPDTAWTLNNLAGVLRDEGDLAGARRRLERSLAICQARLGADHLATGLTLDSLAGVLRAQGDLVGARGLYERALAIREARRGADHSDTAWTLDNLAVVLRDQGDLVGARRLHERALAIFEVRLGADHPTAAWSRRNLAVVAELEDHQ
jgi:tetratricopeptide (TPR) repeat protein